MCVRVSVSVSILFVCLVMRRVYTIPHSTAQNRTAHHINLDSAMSSIFIDPCGVSSCFWCVPRPPIGGRLAFGPPTYKSVVRQSAGFLWKNKFLIFLYFFLFISTCCMFVLVDFIILLFWFFFIFTIPYPTLPP